MTPNDAENAEKYLIKVLKNTSKPKTLNELKTEQ